MRHNLQTVPACKPVRSFIYALSSFESKSLLRRYNMVQQAMRNKEFYNEKKTGLVTRKHHKRVPQCRTGYDKTSLFISCHSAAWYHQIAVNPCWFTQALVVCLRCINASHWKPWIALYLRTLSVYSTIFNGIIFKWRSRKVGPTEISQMIGTR